MANVIKELEKRLRKQGISKSATSTLIDLVKNTCVACKYAEECRKKGIAKEPYQQKCERHELVDKMKEKW